MSICGLQLVVLLAAKWADLLPILVMIIFALLSALIHALGKAMQPQRQGQRNKPPERRVARDARVEAEIKEFLRRATARPPAGEPIVAKPVQAEPVEAEVVGPTPVGGRVTEHVRRRMDTSEFQQRTARLGAEVAQADDQMDARLQKKFGHEVSSLATQPGEAAVAPVIDESALPAGPLPGVTPLASSTLAAMLADPDNVRQAVILSEILKRPDASWP